MSEHNYKKEAEEFAWNILGQIGYNYALSDVEDACKYLDHPELKEEDKNNFHKWAEPYERRCYCGAIGYTEKGRFYACSMSETHLKILRECGFKDIRNKSGEPYVGDRV